MHLLVLMRKSRHSEGKGQPRVMGRASDKAEMTRSRSQLEMKERAWVLPVATTSDLRWENLRFSPVCPGAREPTGMGRWRQLLSVYGHSGLPQGAPLPPAPSLLRPLPSQLQPGTCFTESAFLTPWSESGIFWLPSLLLPLSPAGRPAVGRGLVGLIAGWVLCVRSLLVSI